MMKEVELNCGVCGEKKYPIYVAEDGKIKIAIKCKCGIVISIE